MIQSLKPLHVVVFHIVAVVLGRQKDVICTYKIASLYTVYDRMPYYRIHHV